MKKIALLALAASTAAIATPSMAQTVATGTINISGSVAEKCLVGTGPGTTWGGNVDMLELAASDGTLKSSATLTAQFDSQASTGGFAAVRVVCTTLSPKVTVEATPLSNATVVAGGSGYVNTVHFRADATITTTVGTTPVNDLSDVAGSTSATLTNPLAVSGNNVAITTSGWKTISNGGQQLVAGSYTGGKIVITVAPTA